MKKTMKKNQNMISQFSTIKNLNMPKESQELLESQEESQELAELQEERKALKYDLKSIGPAIKAASKISNGETPLEKENNFLSELQDNYPAFFDSEGEQEGASSLLNKIMGVKRYVTKELKTNKQLSSSLKGKDKTQDYPIPSSEEKEIKAEFAIEKGESSKRKADELTKSEESKFSKKSHISSDEIIDDLPYNPFDDLGTD